MTTTTTKAGLILSLALSLAGVTTLSASPQQSQKQVETKPTPSSTTPDNKQTLTDLYGDPLPSGAIARLGTVRFRHGTFLRDVLVSADAQTVISAGGNLIKIWDAQTGRLQRRIPFDQPVVLGNSLSPDGKLLAVNLMGRQKMRFWDLSNGNEVFPFGDASPSAMRSAFSPNGELLATLEFRNPPVITIWDIRMGKKLHAIEGGVSSAWAYRTLAFSPNGQLLAYSSVNGIRVWDLVGGRQRFALDSGTKTTGGCVAFSSDGKRLATADLPNRNEKEAPIYLWETTTGKKLGVLHGHTGIIRDLAGSPKENVLASVGADRGIRFWDLVKQQEIGKPAGHHRDFRNLHFSADGSVLVSASYSGVLRLWDPHTHEELAATSTKSDSLLWANFAPDGQTLISMGREQIGLWEPLTGRPRRILSSQIVGLLKATLSPDGKTLAAVDRLRGQVDLWDAATGKLVRPFGEGGKPLLFSSCAISADGRRLAGGSYFEDVIRIWDVASGKELQQLKGQQKIGSLAFAPDGATLASASFERNGDYTVRLWKLATGAEIWRKVTRPWVALDMAFSSDGRVLVLVGGLPNQRQPPGEIRLWEAATGKQLKRCEGHREPVRCVAFSPDGRMLATGSEDTTTRLWEIATGKERQCLQGHQDWITAVSFSPDGHLLTTSSLDTTALVWDLTGHLRDGQFQQRNLSAGELKRCWDDLASADAARAYQSILALSGAPEAMAILKKHLSPVTVADPKQVAPLLAALDSEQFAERDKAMSALEQLGLAVEPALRAALDGKPSLEVRRRIETILEKLSGGPRLRFLRALEVLEHIATPEARQVLERLSQGTADMWPTQEAKKALARLATRPTVR